jgi:hypothetical protein
MKTYPSPTLTNTRDNKRPGHLLPPRVQRTPKPNFLADIEDYMPDPHTRPTGTEAQMEPVQKYIKWFEGHQKEMAEAGKENDKGVPPARPKRKATTEGVRSPSPSQTHSLSKSPSSEAHTGTSKGPSTPRKRQR